MPSWWNSQAVIDAAKEGLREASEDEMIFMGNTAQARTPRKTGALRNSARLESFGGMDMTLKYGNSKVDYAVIREMVEARHYTTTGTHSKYLTTGFLRVFGDMASGRVNQTTFKRIEAKVRMRLKMPI